MHYIYRKSDQQIVGHVYNRKTPAMVAEAIRVEISNITHSELKGSSSDYAVIEGPEASAGSGSRGIPSVVDGKIQFEPIPVNPAKASRNAKLLALGFTQAEIDA
tara:strand:+ start:59 stop:370 length:312 start_codon:yes stop_codon:yes gene_type:complete